MQPSLNLSKNMYFFKKRNEFNIKIHYEGPYNLSFNQGCFCNVKEGINNNYTEATGLTKVN